MNLAHIHLLLNHIPVLASAFGFGLLLFAMISRHDTYQRLALIVFVISSAFAIPVYLTGEPAEEIVRSVAPVAEALVEPHEDAALVTLVLLETLGIAAIAALWTARRRPAAHHVLVRVSLVLALIAAGSAAWTANLGGRIRHPEIGGPASTVGGSPTAADADDR